MSKKAFTMMELVIAMAIIALIALVTIPIAKNKMGKVDKFQYYMAYAAVKDIAANIVAQSQYEYDESDLATSSVEDIWKNKQYVAYQPENNFWTKYLSSYDKNRLSYLHLYSSYITDDVDPFLGENTGDGWTQTHDRCKHPHENKGDVTACKSVCGDKYGSLATCKCDKVTVHGATADETRSDWWCFTADGLPGSTGGVMCIGGTVVNGACDCGAKELVNGTCRDKCTSPKTSRDSAGRCVCPSHTTPQNATFNDNTCTWSCNPGYSKRGQKCVKNQDPTPEPTPTPTPTPTPDPTPTPTPDPTPTPTPDPTPTPPEPEPTPTPPEPEPDPRCPEGQFLSESKGACVMPASATSLCQRIRADYNIKNSACDVTAAQMRTNTNAGFKDVTPHIKLSNGLNIYIASDLVKINALADAADVRDRVGYLLYVDVNGNKGKGVLYQDVYPFYIMMNGKILPVYNPAGTGGANSVENLAGNVLYDDYSTGNRVVKVAQTNVNYQTGVCATKYIQSASYCGSIPVDAHCADSNADCRYVVNKPMRFFGR